MQQAQTETLREWLEDRTLLATKAYQRPDEPAGTPSAYLWADYVVWTRKLQRVPLSLPVFVRTLREMGYPAQAGSIPLDCRP
jgi:hypothetical protein